MTFIIYQFFRNNCTSWLFKCAIKENVTNKLNLVLTHFIHTYTMRAIRWGRWEENPSRNRQHYQTNAKDPGNTFYVVSLLSFFPLRLSELYLSESEFYLLRLDCPRQLFILWQRSKLKINICLRCASNSQNWNDKDLFGTDENSMPCRMICWRKRAQPTHTDRHRHIWMFTYTFDAVISAHVAHAHINRTKLNRNENMHGFILITQNTDHRRSER